MVQQERELAAAAEKLAECQETIFLLSKQLKAMRPPAVLMESSPNDKQRTSDTSLEDQPSRIGFHSLTMLSPQQSDQAQRENFSAFNPKNTGGESTSDVCNLYMGLLDTESSSFVRSPISSKPQKQRSLRSSESTNFTTIVPEKQGWGFSRFFYKGKSGQ